MRVESCHVYEDSIEVEPKRSLSANDKTRIVAKHIYSSTAAAAKQGHSLTLVRPRNPRFICRRKSLEIIAAEREGYRRVGNQPSFLDRDLEAIDPSPFAFSFVFEFEDSHGKHTYRCGDWETHTTYWKWTKLYGEQEALRRLSGVYNDVYPAKGVLFAMGTVKARPKQWLLLGILRVDAAVDTDDTQGILPF